jgi:cell division protein FtsB
MSNLIDKLFQGLFFIIFGAIVVTGLMITLPKYHQAAGLEQEKADLQRRIDLMTAEIAAVREKQHRFATDREFVEGIARENRRVFPGEIVFVFEN